MLNLFTNKKMKIKISKSKHVNPSTHEVGFTARVITNGTATFADVCKEAGHNTSMHKAEVEACAALFCEAAAEQLKQGKIVDLGPLGKLYPSCTSGWFEDAEKLTLTDVRARTNYQPSPDIKAAIQGATLTWQRTEPTGDEEPEPEPDDNDNPGGDNGGMMMD